MHRAFQLQSTAEIVSAVVRGEAPREGDLGNGYTYFVHGVGYTVVFPSEAQAHIDASDAGDMFTMYDVRHFLRTAEDPPMEVPDLDEIEAACDRLVEQGVLERTRPGDYVLP